jgi:hypothetical protein
MRNKVPLTVPLPRIHCGDTNWIDITHTEFVHSRNTIDLAIPAQLHSLCSLHLSSS